MDFLVGNSILSQSCWGEKIDLAPPVLPHLFPKISGAKPWTEDKLAVCPEANQARGCAKPSCYVLLWALSPPPRRCLSTVVSQWDLCILDERPGEFNHPRSGIFYQALLQPSIIWISQKGCGRLISPQSIQRLLHVLPSPITAPASFLTVLVLMSPQGWGLLDGISVTNAPFPSLCLTEMCWADRPWALPWRQWGV